MKKILIVLTVLVAFTLSGCSSKIDAETYYINKVKEEQIELDVRIMGYSNIKLEDNQRIVRVKYFEYFDEFIFKPQTVYAFCIYDNCEFISKTEYIEFKE